MQTTAQIISYLNTLVDSINRMFENIDITNLNSNLADKINSSITEHQDTSSLATAAKLKEAADALSASVNSLNQYVDETFYKVSEADGKFATYDYLADKHYSKSEVYNKTEIENNLIGDTGNINWGLGRRRTVVEYVDMKIAEL